MLTLVQPKSEKSITICVEGKKFFFDVKQLTDNSVYFEVMFNGNHKESTQTEIELKEVPLQEFQLFWDWVFGIRITFEGLNLDTLLRLLLLADRLMLEQFRVECHKCVRLSMNSDILFPCAVLETAMFIGDQMLKNIFLDWLHKDELKTSYDRWTMQTVLVSADAFGKFLEERFDQLTAITSEEVETELIAILNNHKQVILEKNEVIGKCVKEQRAKLIIITAQLREAIANNRDVEQHLEEIRKIREAQILLDQGLLEF